MPSLGVLARQSIGKRWRVAAMVLGASLALPACAAQQETTSAVSATLRSGEADPRIQHLLRRAIHNRDKAAMLELGRRYEHGDGVPKDWKLAEEFYGAAAVSEGGSYWSLGTFGSPTMRAEPYRQGLPEARGLYESIRERRKARPR